jgi:hypothetical protein
MGLSPTKKDVWVEVPRRPSSRSITRVQSPATSDDSGDEALASKAKTNGSDAAVGTPDDGATPAPPTDSSQPVEPVR